MTGYNASKRKWSDEKMEQLRALAAAGLSTAEAAAELGVNKNVVIGMAIRARPRIVWVRRPQEFVGIQKVVKDKRRNHQIKQKSPVNPAAAARLAQHEAQQPLPLEPLMVTFMELGYRMCRWPFGDRAFLFCGMRTPESKPYCVHHQRLSRG